ncbi:hypothetical protein GALMADRAFT_143195 [Galerina marginata CBS 339.88]|uniref:Uncharacterized protein n=1 Tax=Galerina marginata (strain CBS 339.88) TaxID=685588 RepID=A0A067T003_GALM3|nr:hypothetical protein GALMADRAFT_143195 [Galerina marginata CBS 339.88]
MSTLPTERSKWIGNNLATIAYGIHIYMVFHSWYLLKGQSTLSPRLRVVLTGFSFIQLLLFTIEIATSGIIEQFMWIDRRKFPGGPVAFFESFRDSWVELYRCCIVWNENWKVMVFPFVIFIAEIGEFALCNYHGSLSNTVYVLHTVLGIFGLAEGTIHDATFTVKQINNFTVSWVALAAALNTMLTGLIVGRIIYISRGNKSYWRYTGVIAILVESAVPMTLAGIAFVATMLTNSIEAFSLSAIVGALNVICPQAKILRVAMGKAWKGYTMDQPTIGINFHEQISTAASPAFHVRTGEPPESSTTVV